MLPVHITMVSAVDPGNGREDGGSAPTYTSIMPILDDLLHLIGNKATAVEVGGDSNEAIVEKASHNVPLVPTG